MLSSVRILCDYSRKTLFLYAFLRKIRTLLAFFTVNRMFFWKSHYSGHHSSSFRFDSLLMSSFSRQIRFVTLKEEIKEAE